MKPTNILVGGSADAGVCVHLTDFGIGQVVSEEALAGVTRAGFTMTMMESNASQSGTHLYMAPELFAGNPASTRSDIYALGVVLYQLLTGDFGRPLTTDWAKQISDPLLRDDLEKCFTSNVTKRFAEARCLAERLRGLKKRRNIRRLQLLGAVVGLALLAACFLGFRRYAAYYTAYGSSSISSSHVSFSAECDQCHGTSASIAKRIFGGVSSAGVDRSCSQCHVNHEWHQPDQHVLATSDFRKNVAVVSVGACMSCHREHAGRGPMKLISDSGCAVCHSDASKLDASKPENHIELVKLPGKHAPATTGTTSILPNGLVRFIPPETFPVQKAVFETFADAHPPFRYEDKRLRDPNVLHFNHALHLRVGTVNGRSLDCNFCHKPAAEGHYHQRISFNTSCLPCHTLQLDASVPTLRIPHGDPENVRAFVRSLPFQYTQVAKQRYKNKAEADAFVLRELTKLRARFKSDEDLENAIFYTINPYKGDGGANVLLPGCAYCHEVKADRDGNPLVTRPIMVDRWLGDGRFTHAKHAHVACIECHQATESRATSDIIMPAKAVCARCHRPHDINAARTLQQPESMGSIQRQLGGVTFDCKLCHASFHAPQESLSSFLKAVRESRTDKSTGDSQVREGK